jgi:hypothetical protein
VEKKTDFKIAMEATNREKPATKVFCRTSSKGVFFTVKAGGRSGGGARARNSHF